MVKIFLINNTDYILEDKLFNNIIIKSFSDFNEIINNKQMIIILTNMSLPITLPRDYDFGIVIGIGKLEDKFYWPLLNLDKDIDIKCVALFLDSISQLLNQYNKKNNNASNRKIEKLMDQDIYQTDCFNNLLSNELKEPINSILGISKMGLNESKNKKDKSYFYKICNAGEMLKHLLEMSEKYKHLVTGRDKGEVKARNLFEILEKRMHYLSYEAEQKGIHLIINIDKKIETNLIQNYDLIEVITHQLLIDLLKNMNRGCINLDAFCIDDSSGSQKIKIEIYNNKEVKKSFKCKDYLLNKDMDECRFNIRFICDMLAKNKGDLIIGFDDEYITKYSFTLLFKKQIELQKESVEIFNFNNINILYIDDDVIQSHTFKAITKDIGIKLICLANEDSIKNTIKQNNISLAFLSLSVFEKEPEIYIKRIKRKIGKIKLILLSDTLCKNRQMYIEKLGVVACLRKRPNIKDLSQVIASNINSKYYNKEITEELKSTRKILNVDNEIPIDKIKERFKGRNKLLEEVINKTAELSNEGGSKILGLYKKDLKGALKYIESLFNLADYLAVEKINKILIRIKNKIEQGLDVEVECYKLNEYIDVIIKEFVKMGFKYDFEAKQTEKIDNIKFVFQKLLIELEDGNVAEIEKYASMLSISEVGESLKNKIDEIISEVLRYNYERASELVINMLEGVIC